MTRPLSMTAFGRGKNTTGNHTWTAEIRSVNHRYSDIKIRIARKYSVLEDKIKQRISEHYSRGHIDVTIDVSGDMADGVKLAVNIPLARQYHECLNEIQQQLALPTPPSLGMFCSVKDIITTQEEEEDMEVIGAAVLAALSAALEEGMAMRRREGASLKKDLLTRLQSFKKTITGIEAMIPQLIQEKGLILKERIDKLLENIDLDPVRLAQEIAIISDKADVTEEVVRLHSHISQCRKFLDLDEPVGRRLDFLMQEFLREINTMASKIANAKIAHLAIDLKNEIEKMREQVQNLE